MKATGLRRTEFVIFFDVVLVSHRKPVPGPVALHDPALDVTNPAFEHDEYERSRF